jgi:hypothetical protein
LLRSARNDGRSRGINLLFDYQTAARPRFRDANRVRMLRNKTLEKKRAQETPGAWPRPQPRVRKKAHEQVTTGKAGSPGVSCAMVLTAYGALSPAIGY